MTAQVHATRHILDRIRSKPALYRAAKRAQPAYLRWLSFSASAGRALISAPWIGRFLLNPTRAVRATDLLADDRERSVAGMRAVHLYEDVCACRRVPLQIEGQAREVWAHVQRARSGPGTIYSFSEGRVWGSDGAVVSRDRCLIGDLSPVIRLPAEAHPVFRRPITNRPERLHGRLGVATGPSANNLSHWLFGILPRLSLLGRSDPRMEQTDWILLPPSKSDFQVETIRRFGIPPSKIVEARHDTFLEALEVLAPSFVSPAFVATSWFLDDLRCRFDDIAPAAGVRRIYVSRKDAPGRRVVNEDAVYNVLARHGFVTVQLEHLPFVEQVAIFKGTEIVVAAHGAGLSNLAFASRETAVVELFSPSYINPMYWCLADELGLRYSCCVGQPTSDRIHPDLVRDDITVDVAALGLALQALIR